MIHSARVPAVPLMLLAAIVSVFGAMESRAAELVITPSEFVLDGEQSQQRVIVTASEGDRQWDVTREVEFVSADVGIATVDSQGIARPAADGSTALVARLGDEKATANVTVRNSTNRATPLFENDIQAVLTATGCNSGACHGKQRGQNGFQLSLLGFDSDFDYLAIAGEARGRRIFPAVPEHSLLLRKATATVPHGGGRRIEVGDRRYQALLDWIAHGLPRKTESTSVLEEVTVHPEQIILSNELQQQLLVTARYSDGSLRDVTELSTFLSSESTVAVVDESGLVAVGAVPGEAAISARFMGHFATARVAIGYGNDVQDNIYASLPVQNFIDEAVWNKLQRLELAPSTAAEDHVYLRRAYIDVIGRLPTAEEARAFLADASPDKRAALVDTLLESPEYADHWANKWVDLLRPNPYRVGIKAVLNYDNWIRDAFRRNMPYDQFVRELVTAEGSTWRNGAATMFRDRRSPDEVTTMVSQLFLGIRLDCAKCHHHPFEIWGQDDFYSFAAYFARVGRKGTGLSPPISGGEEIVYLAPSGSVKHPLTGETMPAKPLFGEQPQAETDADPRELLAAWMTSEDNDYFAQVMANRVWTDLMGRGIVEPVDDLRATNPASNQELLEALGAEFRRGGFDVKHLIRTIMNSYVYGLSSLPGEHNVADTRNYSRYYRQRLRAEVMLDSICNITGIDEQFAALPPESRSNQIWTHRMGSLFLDTFGRPDLNQDPPCERTSDTSVVQALHLMNSPTLHQKITDQAGLAKKLADGQLAGPQVVEELYLRTYNRFPTEDELAVAVPLLEGDSAQRKTAIEDLLWALMNTPEFTFKN